MLRTLGILISPKSPVQGGAAFDTMIWELPCWNEFQQLYLDWKDEIKLHKGNPYIYFSALPRLFESPFRVTITRMRESHGYRLIQRSDGQY